jgi:hypothetical protein
MLKYFNNSQKIIMPRHPNPHLSVELVLRRLKNQYYRHNICAMFLESEPKTVLRGILPSLTHLVARRKADVNKAAPVLRRMSLSAKLCMQVVLAGRMSLSAKLCTQVVLAECSRPRITVTQQPAHIYSGRELAGRI